MAEEAERHWASAWPSLLVSGSARPNALKAIYNHVTSRELPCSSITSAAISAYYPTLTPGLVKILVSQVLCMISEYHMACMVDGSSTTSPIPSQGIEDKLPLLEGYAPPKGTGMTNVRVSDCKARSLHVAVWLHRLDMSLSQEEEASRSLVQLRQQRPPTGLFSGPRNWQPLL